MQFGILCRKATGCVRQDGESLEINEVKDVPPIGIHEPLAAHVEAQAVSGPYGDWLHAIMHRMEGDYGNCRYWCRRAGGEELYAEVAPDFTPVALTERVEALGRDFDSAAAAGLRELQAKELGVLFAHCASA